MKRINNLYEQIISIDNLRLADSNARKGKSGQYGIQVFDRNPEGNLLLLNEMLINKFYRTSEYSTFTVREPKERLVFRLPYFPDRITHHAVMNVLEPLFLKWFTADTYSCIKGKGIHAAANAVRSALADEPGTRFCLKLDIQKFYPSIDHEVLKKLLRKKIKDNDLLWLLDEIIDSAPGLPIGNYLSQYFANYYLTYFDHWMKEVQRQRYYFRYADDLVVLSDSKESLHRLLYAIRGYMAWELKLTIKSNYQIFPVAARGVDFVGYKFYHSHVLLRKSIKKRFARAVSRKCGFQTITAYYGWAKHCASNHLLKKLLTNEQLQRFQNRSKAKQLHGRQNKVGPRLQHTDCGP